MAYVQNLFEKNFLEYASYVIKDRAIPHVDDGLKPVQRRIVHSLLEMDDGKFHKVANVVGHCMKYHPHGDASIYEALVNLANKGFFIDTQGNFGNIFTGDSASAARYIECRVLPFGKEVFYKPENTQYEPSYDGRNEEPVTFPAKIPVVLLLGAEGIAVGMSTKILPHNFVEVLTALRSALRGKSFELYPDFPTGGLLDASGYADGMGKVLVRAKLDTSDPKRIVIRDLPFGSTTESLIDSIEQAAKRGKLKIAGIQDYTTDQVEIEIQLARGVYTQDVVDALYAFTDCEQSISVNLLVIGPENRPVAMTVTELVLYFAKRMVMLLEKELRFELAKLEDILHARTLERIFIEERIYKRIEEMKTAETVVLAVREGFVPFAKEIRRPITDEDIERLLKIPIRRISLYDINKARKEMAEIEAEMKRVKADLADVPAYAERYIDAILAKQASNWKRKTEITRFDKVDVRDAATRNLIVRWDAATGYLGYQVPEPKEAAEVKRKRAAPNFPAAGLPLAVSEFDRIVVIKNDGTYQVIDAPAKLFLDKGLAAVLLAQRERLTQETQTVIFKNAEGDMYIKRTQIEQYILGKTYSLVPEGSTMLALTLAQKGKVWFKYVPGPRIRVTEDEIAIEDLLVKGVNSIGVRLGDKPIEKFEIRL